jgi:cyclic pyranopterin phosphate synthase
VERDVMGTKSSKLSHVDRKGRASMVDVGAKPATQRRAVAEGRVRISAALAKAIKGNTLKKGNLLETARLAGIGAAKRTDELVPLCHSLPLDHVQVEARMRGRFVYLRAEAATSGKTGVEMEAFVAVSIAAATVVDMGKAIDPGMVIENIRLVHKSGGRRGTIEPHCSEFPAKRLPRRH